LRGKVVGVRCVLLHPHPDRGGNQHNSVVGSLFAALEDATRFDFVSGDLGVATGQVIAELDAGRAWLVGYSFGGAVASLVDDPRVIGWYLIAPALTRVAPVVGADCRPKHVLAAEHDAIFPPASLQDATAGWTATTHEVVAGADHSLVGYEDDVAVRCVTWLNGAARR
jgi:alpha/beta superfamily hydrolase